MLRAVILIGIVALFVPCAGAAIITSTFDSGADGWTIVENTSGISYSASGGNGGGYVWATDDWVSHLYQFSAPAKFLGNQSAMYGTALKFDARTNVTNNDLAWSVSPVVLVGGTSTSKTIVYTDVSNVGTRVNNWVTQNIPLYVTPGWTYSGTSTQVTASDFQDVLSHLTAVKVVGEWQGGTTMDTGSMDNFSMGAAMPATPKVLAWWKLDEGTGTTVADSSNNGHTLTLGKAGAYMPTWGAAGSGHSGLPADGALRFTGGTVMEARAPSDDVYMGSAVTLSAWFTTTSSTANEVLLGKHNGLTDGSFYIGLLNTGQIDFTMIIDNARTDIKVTKSYASSNGVWHNLIASYDGAMMRFYYDGVLAGTTARVGGIKWTAYDLVVGNYNLNDTGWSVYGAIDDVSVFSTALSDGGVALNSTAGGDIATLYSQGAGALLPEPATVGLLAVGLVGVLLRRRSGR